MDLKKISYPDYTGKIRYKIVIDGHELTEKYRQLIVSISSQCGLNKISSLELIMNNDLIDVEKKIYLSDDNTIDTHKNIEVYVGYEKASNCIFKGIIVKKNVSKLCTILTITAKHEAEKLTRVRKMISYENDKDDNIIQSICSKENIKCNIEKTKASPERIVQYNSTDWDFINMRAEANGLLLYTNEKGIVARAPQYEKVNLNLIKGYNIIDIEEEIDIRHSHINSYVEKKWDDSEQEVTDTSSSSKNLTQSKDEQGETQEIINLGTQETDSTTNVLLESKSIRNDLSYLKGKITTIGYAPIEPCDIVELHEIGKSFNGKVIVSNVIHSLKSGVWETRLEIGYDDTPYVSKYDNIAEKPAMGTSIGVNGLQYAKIEGLEGDPLNKGRIYISLIGLPDTKLWARLATFDAGNGRGSFFIPEKNDEVIVGFIDNNPNQPIILGSLHSGKSKQPYEIKDNNTIKGYVSKENIKITIDDDNKALYFETPGGNKLSLNDKDKGIIIEDQNGNKITLNDQGISIESQKAITIKSTQDVNLEGNNTTIKANAQLKAQGMASEVSATGNTVIKGGIVQIN